MEEEKQQPTKVVVEGPGSTQPQVPTKSAIPGILESKLNELADAELWKKLREIESQLNRITYGDTVGRQTESAVQINYETSSTYVTSSFLRIIFNTVKHQNRRQFITNWITKVEKISADVEDVTEVVRDLEEKIDR